jgi:hypothetical protein
MGASNGLSSKMLLIKHKSYLFISSETLYSPCIVGTVCVTWSQLAFLLIGGLQLSDLMVSI